MCSKASTGVMALENATVLFAGNVGVKLCRRDGCVTQQVLNIADIDPFFEQKSRD
jgi:hypothetical protein